MNRIQHLFSLVNRIESLNLVHACEALQDYERFRFWPASLGFHHAYEHGILVHTTEVIETALHIAKKFPSVNLDVLIAAAAWHDLGKIWEYREVSGYEFDGRFLHRRHLEGVPYGWVRDPSADSHIITSAVEFTVAARKEGVAPGIEKAVVHCILSHHGPVKEWGSPVAPESIEALILHQADMLSAKHGATKERITES